MKAFLLERFGKKRPLRSAETPMPGLRDDDVLDEVHAAGVDLVDSKIRDGQFKLILPYKRFAHAACARARARSSHKQALLTTKMTRTPPRSKNASHDRIVAAGARAIRRSGYGGVSIADIMKEANLTHGGFYAHFPSREAMLVELSDRAGADAIAIFARVAEEAPPAQSLQALLNAYLCEEHVRQPAIGCPIAALGTDMPRQSPPIRRASPAASRT